MLKVPVELMNAKSGERKKMLVDYGSFTQVDGNPSTVAHKLGVKPDIVLLSDLYGAKAFYQYASDYTNTQFSIYPSGAPSSACVVNWFALAFVDE